MARDDTARGISRPAPSLFMGVVSALLIACPGVPSAQTPPFRSDFSAHRVKVGEGGPGNRIRVQIDPVEQALRLAVVPRPEPAPAPPVPAEAVAQAALTPRIPGKAAYDWFWDAVPAAQDAVAGRYPKAMAALGLGPGGAMVAAPRMQQMQDIAQRYGTEILRATLGTQVSPALVLAVMGIESGGKPLAESPAGAVGLMQLIPATAARFGVRDSTDPAQNIKGGVAYLDWLMDRFDRDPLMVLAAYNAGEGAVAANRGVPPYPETRDYVPKVLAAWAVAQGLCLTPPELVTDPCVFRIIAAGG